MRLFPTVHATGDLPARHRAHLERHGLAFVGPDDDPDVILVPPGAEPGAAVGTAGAVVLVTADSTPAVTRLLATHGITAEPGRGSDPVALVPADLTADDLLAWTSELRLPVHATLRA